RQRNARFEVRSNIARVHRRSADGATCDRCCGICGDLCGGAVANLQARAAEPAHSIFARGRASSFPAIEAQHAFRALDVVERGGSLAPSAAGPGARPRADRGPRHLGLAVAGRPSVLAAEALTCSVGGDYDPVSDLIGLSARTSLPRVLLPAIYA